MPAVAGRNLHRHNPKVTMPADKIEVQNVGQPGKIYRVDAAKYAEMRQVMLSVLPVAEPGMTVSEVNNAVRPHLAEAVFPGGETCGWWVKCVQLDLEAKGMIARAKKPPVRLWVARNA